MKLELIEVETAPPAAVPLELVEVGTELEEGGISAWEGFVKPTLDQFAEVFGTVGAGIVAAPAAGIRGLAEPGAIRTEGGLWTDRPELIGTPGFAPHIKFDWQKAERGMERVYEKIPAPTTPEAAVAAERVGKVIEWPFRKTAEGWQLIGAWLEDLSGIPGIEPLLGTVGEAAAIFAVPGLRKAVGRSTWFRKLSVKQRALVIQSLDDVIRNNPTMTEGQILRKWNNPQWRAEALKRRIKPEPPLEDLSGIPGIEPLLGTVGEAAAIFAVPGLRKAVGRSTWFRKLSVKQRALVIQSLDDVIRNNPTMTEGQILRKWNNPQWRAEALKRRIKPEPPPEARAPEGPPKPFPPPISPALPEKATVPDWIKAEGEITLPYPGQERLSAPATPQRVEGMPERPGLPMPEMAGETFVPGTGEIVGPYLGQPRLTETTAIPMGPPTEPPIELELTEVPEAPPPAEVPRETVAPETTPGEKGETRDLFEEKPTKARIEETLPTEPTPEERIQLEGTSFDLFDESGFIDLSGLATIYDRLKSDLSIELTDKDLTTLEQYIKLPFWLSQSRPQFKRVYDIQNIRDQHRNILTTGFLEELQPALKLKGKAEKTLGKLLWRGDILKSVLKPEAASKYPPEIIEGYYVVRSVLDYIWEEDLPQLMKSLGYSDLEIDEYRRQFGSLVGYFIHPRAGKYFIRVMEQGRPDVIYRQHFDDIVATLTKLSPKGAWKTRKLRKEYPGKEIQKGKVTRIPEEVYFQVSPAATEQIINVAMRKMGSETPETLSAALKQAVAEVIQSRGFMVHGIKRRGVPGYDTSNWKEALVDYISGYAGFKTKLLAASDFNARLAEIDAAKFPNEYQYASKYIHDVMRNREAFDTVADKVRALFFYKYLGGVIKSAALNLTQNFVAGVPNLSMHTKWSTFKLSNEMRKAAQDIIKTLYDKNAPGKRLSKEIMSGLSAARRKGIISDQYTEELMGSHLGRYGSALRRIANLLRWMFGRAEILNRETIYKVAYDVARKEKGYGHADAMQFAEDMVERTHFVYGKGALPPFARGGKAAAGARAGYTFRTFTHNLLSMYRDLYGKGIKGKIAVGKALAALLAFAGISGIPFIKNIEDIVGKLTGKNIRSEIAEMAGRWKDMIIYGFPGLFGIDMTGSISIEVPISLYDIGGVVAEIPRDIYATISDLGRKDFRKALEDLPITPNVLSYAMAAYRLKTRGMTTRRGTPLTDEKGKQIILTPKEAMWKTIGFQPTKLSETYRKQWAEKQKNSYWEKKKHDLADRFVIAYIEAKNTGKPWPTPEVNEIINEIDLLHKQLPIEVGPISIPQLLARAVAKMSKRKIISKQRTK